jgi:hypothetical protein
MEGHEPKIMFNKSEIKFAYGGTAGLHYRVPSSRQWAFSRDPMKPVGSQVTENAQGNTPF